MRYSSYINNIKALEWGLDLKTAYLFSWFYELPSWAESIVIGGKVYYFASKNKALEELPILTDKVDTVYRYYKKIEELGLIKTKKIAGKDYIYLTKKAKNWNAKNTEFNTLGNKSDTRKQIRHSDNNPTKLGNLSESHSDLNPTYNNTILDKKTNINNNRNFDFLDECSGSHLWIESICRLNKTKPEVVKEHLIKFTDYLTTIDDTKQNLREYKSHFSHWFSKQEFNTTTAPKRNTRIF
ncbi:hypothetical protein GO491_11860 [Flavobacteriaceae bacterium Ap0902]|nr:hypothetical protein [Flavobacteriaceae bacterium Ap0902]